MLGKEKKGGGGGVRGGSWHIIAYKLTSAADADLVHDVTDTKCETQNGRDYGRVSPTFKRLKVHV